MNWPTMFATSKYVRKGDKLDYDEDFLNCRLLGISFQRRFTSLYIYEASHTRG